jgi:hypothetical protein
MRAERLETEANSRYGSPLGEEPSARKKSGGPQEIRRPKTLLDE